MTPRLNLRSVAIIIVLAIACVLLWSLVSAMGKAGVLP